MAKVPKYVVQYLTSHGFSGFNTKINKKLIITDILNIGNHKTVKWLFNKYSIREIKSVVRKPVTKSWYKISLSYWQRILKINIPKKDYSTALIDKYRPAREMITKVFRVPRLPLCEN